MRIKDLPCSTGCGRMATTRQPIGVLCGPCYRRLVWRAKGGPAVERARAASRAQKDRYRGTCEDCGAPTTGCNGPGTAPTHCAHCAPAYTGVKRKVWTRDRLITAIGTWNALYREPPAVCDWNPRGARDLGDEDRARRWERAHGRWPSAHTVIREFGSWNAGLSAAGLDPRASHGGDGNEQRRRKVREKALREAA